MTDSEVLFLHYSAISDVGRIRKDNQDSGYVGPWLIAVCDGVGGAAPDAGSGLHGLADRVAALDGALQVASPPGGGTRLRANLPC